MIFNRLFLAFCMHTWAFSMAEEIAAQENGTIILPGKKSLSGLLKGNCIPGRTVCVNDQFIICSDSGYDMVVQYCEFNNQKGYCNCEGTECVPASIPPTGCKISTRKCYQPGMKYPVASDCHIYAYCDDNGIETAIACPNGWVYNPTSQECKPTGTCETITCTGNAWPPYYIPFPQSPEYYVFCGGFWDTRVSKCRQPGYAAERKGCAFRCVKDGLFQDPKPDRCLEGLYYACSKEADGTYKKEKFKCPTGKYFDNNIEMCTFTAKCPQ